ncbi:protachykinin [Megalops cyprinoides]|uniref:protachykinin n=1 Tax=Megalops cyprinoides TaxID=118141 RepID=UPI001863D069|nr:protachykinin [Megalops cyprinoides]
MKLLLSVIILCVSLAEILCEEVGPSEDLNHWTNSIQTQDQWLVSDPLSDVLRRITRKPRPRQFFGLMGKRSSASAQITRKRQKLNSFVGLMGKRSQEVPDMYEWSTIQNYDQQH